MPTMEYEIDPYDLGYSHGFTEDDNQNPYIENSPEWNEYEDGFYQGSQDL